jgi:hypothetical protein
VKIGEWLRKLVGRSEPKEGESVNEAFTSSYEQAASTWIPSQQDRPRH